MPPIKGYDEDPRSDDEKALDKAVVDAVESGEPPFDDLPERDWERLFQRLAAIAQIERVGAFRGYEMIQGFHEMRSVLANAGVEPTQEDAEQTTEKLGIDVKAWAAEVRERVKKAAAERENEPTDAVYPVFLDNRIVGIFTDYEKAVGVVRERYGKAGPDGSSRLRGVVISTFPLDVIDDEGLEGT